MSDAKPRHPAREAARGETGLGEPVPAAATPMIAPEIPPPADPQPQPASGTTAPAEPSVEDAWTSLTAAQVALACGLGEAAVEMTGMTRAGLAAGTDAAIALLGARTIAEFVEVNAGLARRGADALIEGSARLSEIGVKALADASRPFRSRFGTA